MRSIYRLLEPVNPTNPPPLLPADDQLDVKGILGQIKKG
jgi:hypothetical protein